MYLMGHEFSTWVFLVNLFRAASYNPVVLHLKFQPNKCILHLSCGWILERSCFKYWLRQLIWVLPFIRQVMCEHISSIRLQSYIVFLYLFATLFVVCYLIRLYSELRVFIIQCLLHTKKITCVFLLAFWLEKNIAKTMLENLT